MNRLKKKRGSHKQLKIAILFILAVVLVSLGLFLLFPNFKADSTVVPAGSLGVPFPKSGTVNNLYDYISALVTFCVNYLGPILATGLIIYGGYLYIFSQGDNQMMTNAKDTIFGAIWGYILLFMVKLIMGIVGV